MKKFSKVLCLVLVLAMMAGLCCFGTSAAYKDADKINYKEAVDVLSAVGVLQGDENGFRPQDGLKRAEATKIVAYLCDAADITGTCSFKDCKGHWAESFIAYCASKGYVEGVGGNKFDPDGALTGSAFAKMLLGVLGYKAQYEGMTGADWEIAVAKLVKNTGLNKGIAKFDGTKAIDRETAAQLALNALKAIMVEYPFAGVTVTTKDGTKVETGNMIAQKLTYAKDTNGVIGHDGYVRLGEDLYNDDLVYTENKNNNDDFGRPAAKWEYEKKVVGTYQKAADGVIVVAQGKTEKKVATILDEEGFEVATKVVEGETVNDVAVALRQVSATNVTYNPEYVPGTGTVLELYKNPDGKVNLIVAYDYDLVEVTKVTTLKSSNALAKKGATVQYALKNVNTAADVETLNYVDTLSKNVTGAQKIGTWAKGDKLVVVENSVGKLIYIAAADSVTGAISAWTGNSYTLDGTKYTYGVNYVDVKGINQNVDFKKGEYALYLDPNDYIIGSKTISGATTANADDIVYVIAAATSGTNTEGDAVYFVKSINMGTGEYQVLQTSKTPEIAGKATPYPVAFYLTSTDEDDALCFAAAADNTKLTDTVDHINKDSEEYFASTKLDVAASIKADTKSVSTDAGKVYLTDDTLFIFEKGNKTTAVTGNVVKTLPEGSLVLVAKDADQNPIATAIVIKDTKYVETIDSNTLYITGEASIGTNSVGKEFTAYDLDGEEVTITLKKTASTPSAGFYKYFVDADGLYTIELVDNYSTNGQVKFTKGDASKYGNLLTLTNCTKIGSADTINFVDVAMADDIEIVDLTTAKDIDTVADLCAKTSKVSGYAIVVDKAVKTIVVIDNPT